MRRENHVLLSQKFFVFAKDGKPFYSECGPDITGHSACLGVKIHRRKEKRLDLPDLFWFNGNTIVN
jgi:hypothetical protein